MPIWLQTYDPLGSVLTRFFVPLVVVAADILNGTRQPDEALDLIHGQVLGPLNHPADLMESCHVWEGIDPTRGFASLSDSERKDAARALAPRTLDTNGGEW